MKPRLLDLFGGQEGGMSNVVAFKGKNLVRAADLGDGHMGRLVRVRDIEGPLVGLIPTTSAVIAVLIVGGSRAFFPLALDAHVEVGPKATKETP